MTVKKYIRLVKKHVKIIYDEINDPYVKRMVYSTNRLCRNMNREFDRTLNIPSPSPFDTITGMSNGVMNTLPVRRRRLGS